MAGAAPYKGVMSTQIQGSDLIQYSTPWEYEPTNKHKFGFDNNAQTSLDLR